MMLPLSAPKLRLSSSLRCGARHHSVDVHAFLSLHSNQCIHYLEAQFTEPVFTTVVAQRDQQIALIISPVISRNFTHAKGGKRQKGGKKTIPLWPSVKATKQPLITCGCGAR